MNPIEKFEDIIAWQKARILVNKILDKAESERLSRHFCLRDQITRASISIMNNISEGYERDSNREFIRFLAIAKGSCGEVRSLLHLIYDRNHFDRDEYEQFLEQAVEISKIISGLIKSLQSSSYKGTIFKTRQ
jgi:four helix bundle protein